MFVYTCAITHIHLFLVALTKSLHTLIFSNIHRHSHKLHPRKTVYNYKNTLIMRLFRESININTF